MFILSEAYYHNSEVIQDISQLIGYHGIQSGSVPPDALYPVAQHCPAFHAWEYWESVWDAREWWEDSAALQTWMDVESILSARGIHRKWPSICRQGNMSKHIVCRLIIEGLACWGRVWCNWWKTNGLPATWLLQTQLTGAISKFTQTAPFASSLPQFFWTVLFNHVGFSVKSIPLYLKLNFHWFLVWQVSLHVMRTSNCYPKTITCGFFQQLLWSRFRQRSHIITTQISQ